jgi:hypothetical protein
MVLVVCDKIIYQKIKLLIAMDMAGAALKHLNVTSSTKTQTSQVTLETETGDQNTTVTEYPGFDKTTDDLERVLLGQLSVFNQLIRRYHLKEEIQRLYPQLNLSETGVIPWKQMSFTRLRLELIDIFSRQDRPMAFLREVPARFTTTTTAATTSTGRNSITKTDTPPRTRSMEHIPSVSTLTANYAKVQHRHCPQSLISPVDGNGINHSPWKAQVTAGGVITSRPTSATGRNRMLVPGMSGLPNHTNGPPLTGSSVSSTSGSGALPGKMITTTVKPLPKYDEDVSPLSHEFFVLQKNTRQ